MALTIDPQLGRIIRAPRTQSKEIITYPVQKRRKDGPKIIGAINLFLAN